MTKVFYFFIIIFLINCKSSTPQNPFVGTWQLVEELNDPGDGNGKYEKIKSSKTITINSDGTFSSKGNFCTMDLDAEKLSKGIYRAKPRVDYDVNYKILIPENCNTRILFKIENSYLVLHYPCIEGCSQKLKKIR